MVEPKDIDFYSLGFNYIATRTMFMATQEWQMG